MRLDLAQIGEGARIAPELVLRETSPLVYDWDATEEQIYAAAPRTTLPSAFDIAPPGAPQGEEELYVTRDGSAVKVLLRVRWKEAQSGFVETDVAMPPEIAAYRQALRDLPQSGACLVGCKGDDENRFHIAQSRAISNAAHASKGEMRTFEISSSLLTLKQYPALRTRQPPRSFTHSEGIGGTSTAPPTDSLDM